MINKEELITKSKYIRINTNSSIPFTIDLRTHKVLGWQSIDNSKTIYEKVRDEGIYSLLDDNQNEIFRLEGYVPNKFLPEEDGYGDYITLDINDEGEVTNWYENPDFTEFIDSGYCTIPVTSKENIEKLIDNFLRPLRTMAKTELIFTEEEESICCGTHAILSVYKDSTIERNNIFEISDYEEIDKERYKKIIEKIKTLWIYYEIEFAGDSFYGNRFSKHHRLLFIIQTGIELYEEYYLVMALNKQFPYGEYPSKEELGKIIEAFKENYNKGINTKEEYLKIMIP